MAHRRGGTWRALIAIGCAAVVLTACDKSAARNADSPAADSTARTSTGPISVVDDAGRTVTLAQPARRVVSLIPSATETLLALGAAEQLIARTRYDVAPEVQHLPLVGGSVDPSIEMIVSLKPELVVSWESDKRQQFRERLTALGIPIFMLRTQDTTDVFRGLGNLGALTGHSADAQRVSTALRERLAAVGSSVQSLEKPSVMYVVFHDPPMTAGPNTFIGQLITLAGGRSIFEDTPNNWPNVTMEEIVRRDPDVIVVPVGEFKAQALSRLKVMQGWRNLRAIREGRVVAVPADLLSRPSPNIGLAAEVLRSAMHPQFPSPVAEPDSIPDRALSRDSAVKN
ncbi:MAG TPA: cobalamin-binding protein [Gemmatimonas sp.]|uniref:ABC transporter substrate-binding protein n=1 Tax=Gemmatimonas sp. TaxID=1962908 RepID=UPI002ED9C754